MALSAGSMKQDMIEATDGVEDASGALSALGDAIADNIMDNAVVNFAWVAVNPGGAPDPTVVAAGEISNVIINLSTVKAVGSSPAPAVINATQAALILGLTAALYNITDPGFATSPGAMATSPSLALLSLAGVQGKDTRDAAYDAMASAIVTWVKTQLPVAPCAGTHAAFTGAGTVTTIV